MTADTARQHADWLGHGAEPEVSAACHAAIQAVTAAGIELVSVYLESGATLRCYAISGYRQLFDGISPDVGVIGRVWRSGRAVEVHAGDERYRAAVPGVHGEICLPVLRDGACVGVLNAETTAGFPEDARALLEQVAEQLGERLASVPRTLLSPSQRLLAHVADMTASEDAGDLAHRMVSAGTDISGLSSGMLLLGSPVHCAAVSGPMGPALARVSHASLAEVDGWVAHGGSSRTSPDDGGSALHGQQELLDAGVCGLVVVSVGSGPDRAGSLLLADPDRTAVDRPTAEALELLGALGAAYLRTARVVGELRVAATTDPLTGLGHRSAFDRTLQAHLSTGAPSPLVVLMVDLDGFKAVNDTRGHAAGDALLVTTVQRLAGSLREGDALFRLGGDEFATVLRVKDRAEAEAVAQRIVEGCRREGLCTVSVGGALATPSMTARELVARADAALYQAKADGRDRACVLG
jgi:diguanylate cyclase (GGDEF)-like protein